MNLLQIRKLLDEAQSIFDRGYPGGEQISYDAMDVIVWLECKEVDLHRVVRGIRASIDYTPRYLIYSNDNGTDVYPVPISGEPEDTYMRLLKEHGDSYIETDAFVVYVDDKLDADRVSLADFEEVS